MDPSHNTWVNPNNQSTTNPVNGTLQNQNTPNSKTSAQINQYEAMIEKLTHEVNYLKTAIQSEGSSKVPYQSKPNKGKKPASKAKLVPVSGSVSKKKKPAQYTPKKPQQAASAPPEFASSPRAPKPHKSNTTKDTPIKPTTSKHHPPQIQTSEFPPGFLPTKNALFVHIKILWGLLKQDSVPKAPNLGSLEEFYRRFRQLEQIKEAIKTRSNTCFSNQTHVQFLKNAQGGRVKYGKSIIHLGSNFIHYAQGLMNQLGLRVWCPNLDEDSASLHNSADRIAELSTFTELATTTAYTDLKIDPNMAQNMTLLIPA